MHWERWCRLGAAASAVLLAVCTGSFLWGARGWPLVNDSALMHYVVLLMQAGLAPYREINDYNLPGAYATAWLPDVLGAWLHVPPAAMGRWADAALLLAAGAAMFSIARRFSWFAGVFAGSLFALYHGRDGIGQAGQRDLWVAVLLLCGLAFLVAALRSPRDRARAWRAACFGLCLGAATLIKPTACLYLVCAAPLLLAHGRARAVAALCGGCALPLVAAWVFLLHWGAIGALGQVLRVELPYHASLGVGTFAALLRASSISSLVKLAALAGLAAMLAGGWRSTAAALGRHAGIGWQMSAERGLLPVCVMLGLVSFVAQGKGYPYQRYPYVAFLLLFAALEFSHAVASSRVVLRVVGAVGLGFGVLLCAPSYARGAAGAHWSTVAESMEQAIRRQARMPDLQDLQGQVQCLDMVSGCTDALLHLRLREATGTMYDEMLFPQAPVGWGEQTLAQGRSAVAGPAVLAQQARFQHALPRAAPRVILVSAWLFPEGPGAYRKLELWPWWNAYLAEHYRLVEEHAFARSENGPMGFRVYLRQGPATPIH